MKKQYPHLSLKHKILHSLKFYKISVTKKSLYLNIHYFDICMTFV